MSNYPAGMSQYDNMPQSPYYDNSHDDYLDKRSCEIASILIRKGRAPEWAYRVGARFADIEFNKMTRWD